MKLGYPTAEEVKGWDPSRDAFKIIRAAALVGEPDETEVGIKALIDDRLRFVSADHRETIEKAVGYGPPAV